MNKTYTIVVSLLITLTAASSSLLAQTFSRNCPSVVPKIFTQVFQEEWGMVTAFDLDENLYGDRTPQLNNLACSQFEKLAGVITKIKKKFGPYLNYPTRLTVNMVTADSNAYNFAGHLNLPKQFFIYNKNFDPLFKHPKHNLPIWAHEYGHSIFNQMLLKVSPEWKKASNIIRNQKNSLIRFTKKHNPLIRKCKVQYVNLKKQGYTQAQIEEMIQVECSGPIAKLRKQVVRQMQNQNRQLAPYMEILSATGSYNEFFADVVTVALFEDGRVVHDALHRSGLKYHRSPQKSLGRDFSTRKNDLNVLESMHPNHVEHQIHNLLSAARRHVWKYYISNPLYKKNPGLMVQAIFKATAKQVLQLAALYKGKGAWIKQYLEADQSRVPPNVLVELRAALKKIVVQLNKSLIKEIDAEMKLIR